MSECGGTLRVMTVVRTQAKREGRDRLERQTDAPQSALHRPACASRCLPPSSDGSRSASNICPGRAHDMPARMLDRRDGPALPDPSFVGSYGMPTPCKAAALPSPSGTPFSSCFSSSPVAQSIARRLVSLWPSGTVFDDERPAAILSREFRTDAISEREGSHKGLVSFDVRLTAKASASATAAGELCPARDSRAADSMIGRSVLR